MNFKKKFYCMVSLWYIFWEFAVSNTISLWRGRGKENYMTKAKVGWTSYE